MARTSPVPELSRGGGASRSSALRARGGRSSSRRSRRSRRSSRSPRSRRSPRSPRSPRSGSLSRSPVARTGSARWGAFLGGGWSDTSSAKSPASIGSLLPPDLATSPNSKAASSEDEGGGEAGAGALVCADGGITLPQVGHFTARPASSSSIDRAAEHDGQTMRMGIGPSWKSLEQARSAGKLILRAMIQVKGVYPLACGAK